MAAAYTSKSTEVEEKSRYYEAKDNAGEVGFTVYSTTGKAVPISQLQAQVAKFDRTGQVDKGYKVLPPGFFNTMRMGFETVNKPIQEFLPAAGQAAVTAITNPFKEAFSGVNPNDPQQLAQLQEMLRSQPNIGTNVGRFIGEQIDTPGKASAVAGTTLGAIASGSTSLLPQMIAMGGGAGLGRMLGTTLTGTGAEAGNAALEAGLTIAALGMQAGVKYILGKAVSQRASEDVASELMNIARKRHPELANRP